jgi:hypothetical protein
MKKTLIALTLVGLMWAAAGEEAVPFPEGYRGWRMLHGTLLGPKHGSLGPCEKPCTGGMMYFYGNAKAMEGFKTGKFADGSVIADEVLEILGDDQGGGKEGTRRGIGVMVKDAKRYASTGGWGYASFKGDSKVDHTTAEQRKTCFACHMGKKDRDYVFTEYRER